VRSLSLLGSDDVVLQDWIDPCFDWGFFYVPDVGEQIEIEVVSGSDRDEVPGQAFLEAPDFRWRGKRFYDPERPLDQGGPKTPINEAFKTNYGKRRGFATPAGHVLLFDDTPGQESIVLSWKNALGQLQQIELKDGEVLLGTSPTLGVARLTDSVAASTTPPTSSMSLWISAVTTYINGLAPGTLTLPTTFGAISGASTKVKSE